MGTIEPEKPSLLKATTTSISHSAKKALDEWADRVVKLATYSTLVQLPRLAP